MESWWNDPEFSDLSEEREGWWDDLESYELSVTEACEAVSRPAGAQYQEGDLPRCAANEAVVREPTNPPQSISRAGVSAAGPSTRGAQGSSDHAAHRNFVDKHGYASTDIPVVRGFPFEGYEAARTLSMLRNDSAEQPDHSEEVIPISQTSTTSQALPQVQAPQKLTDVNRDDEQTLSPPTNIVKQEREMQPDFN